MEILGYEIRVRKGGLISKWGMRRQRWEVEIRHGERVAKFYAYGDGGRSAILSALADILFAYIGEEDKKCKKTVEKAKTLDLGLGEVVKIVETLMEGRKWS